MSINGALLARVAICAEEGDVTSLAVGSDGRHLIVGTRSTTPCSTSVTGGSLQIRRLHSLEEVRALPLPTGTGVSAAILTCDDTNLLVATTDGSLLVYTDPAVSVRLVQQMLRIGWAAEAFTAF